MLVEEFIEIDLGDYPSVPKLIQFGKGIKEDEPKECTVEIKKRV